MRSLRSTILRARVPARPRVAEALVQDPVQRGLDDPLPPLLLAFLPFFPQPRHVPPAPVPFLCGRHPHSSHLLRLPLLPLQLRHQLHPRPPRRGQGRVRHPAHDLPAQFLLVHEPADVGSPHVEAREDALHLHPRAELLQQVALPPALLREFAPAPEAAHEGGHLDSQHGPLQYLRAQKESERGASAWKKGRTRLTHHLAPLLIPLLLHALPRELDPLPQAPRERAVEHPHAHLPDDELVLLLLLDPRRPALERGRDLREKKKV